MRPAWILTALATLACAGLGGNAPEPRPEPPPVPVPEPEPEPDGAWVSAAVEEALAWEVMPGTTEEPDASGERAEALRHFFLAHPEYADPAAREPLAAHACGMDGTEAAHAWLTHPPPKTPVTIDDDRDDWRVLVVHADVHCTSDDWAWYSSEAVQGAQARGALTAWGGPDEDVVVVRSNGREVARVPLSGQGFLAARAGTEPADLPYDPSVISEGLDAMFGPAP